MNKNDVRIMYVLAQNQCFNKLKSFTIAKISELTNLSKAKARYTMRMLIEIDYIAQGFPDGKSSTFYITPKGLSFLKEVQT